MEGASRRREQEKVRSAAGLENGQGVSFGVGRRNDPLKAQVLGRWSQIVLRALAGYDVRLR